MVTTISAARLDVILNSCMKWLIIKRPWLLLDTDLFFTCTGQTNIKQYIVHPSHILLPGCFCICSVSILLWISSVTLSNNCILHV